jgi:hypothetical protein
MKAVFAWLFSVPFGREKLSTLVICMVGIEVLSAQLAWRIGPFGASGTFGVLRSRSWIGRWLAQVLVLLYHVGIPLTVLWRGVRSPDLYRAMGVPTTFVGRWDSSWLLLLLGLGEPEKVLDLWAGVAIGLVMLGLLSALWAWYVRVVLGKVGEQEARVVSVVPWWEALLRALYMQLTWALYRAFAATLSDDRFVVASISLVLIAAAWISSPRRRRELLSTRGYLVVLDWLCALFTAFLSALVPALWFLVTMHTLWVWSSGQLLAHLSQASASAAVSRLSWSRGRFSRT